MAYPNDVGRSRALVRKFAKNGLVAPTGIDLNPEYGVLARDRVGSVAAAAGEVGEAAT